MRTLFLSIFMLVGVAVFGQSNATFNSVQTISNLQIPRYVSLSNATAAGSRPGNFVFVYAGVDSGVHVRSFDNSRWIKVNAGGGGGGGSYTAGNGIKIVGNEISWANTLNEGYSYVNIPSGSSNYLSISKVDESESALASIDIGWQNTIALNKYQPGINSSTLELNNIGIKLNTYNEDGSNESFHRVDENQVTLFSGKDYQTRATGIELKGDSIIIGAFTSDATDPLYDIVQMKITADSIYFLRGLNDGSYNPLAAGEKIAFNNTINATIGNDVLLINNTTGSIVKISPATLKRLNQGTPTGTADPQGQVGDELFDTNFHYIKTSAGWKRVALATF